MLRSETVSDPRPVIGICAALEPARWGVWERRAVLLPYEYVTHIQRAEGLALMIAPDEHLTPTPTRSSTSSTA